MTLTFIKGHSCIRNPKLLCPFSLKFGWKSVCCHTWFIEAHAKINFAHVVFKGENSADGIL